MSPDADEPARRESDAALEQPSRPESQESASSADRVATALMNRLLSAGIDGQGRLASAQEVADRAMRAAHGDPERAIAHVVAVHTRLAAAGGFVTGLGGFVTMMVALPANVVEFYLIATRMVAAVAAVRGHDLRRPDVRTAVLLTLAGNDATAVLAKAGVGTISGRITVFTMRRFPPGLLMVINKGVAFRLLVRFGQKALSRLGRAVPLLGGVIGGVFDLFFLRQIAEHADRRFPPTGAE